MKYFRKIKTPLFLFALLFVFSCSKNEFEIEPENVESENFEINVEMAISIAQDFSSSSAFAAYSEKERPVSNTLKSGNIKPEKKIKKTSTINCDDGKPALYVVEYEPTGFVIVSASKKTETILAFSETGFFQYDPSIPSGLNDWVDYCKKGMKKLRDNEEIPSELNNGPDGLPPPEDEEETISGGTVIHAQEGPLLTTNWGQEFLYNDQCPNLSCSGDPRAPAGCTAVAIGQIMKHWEHPNSYTWTSMPDNVGSYETALLLSDIGEDIDAVYSCVVTTAYMSDARDALVNDYGYSSSASYLTYNSSTVEDQIDNGWPVALRGENSSGVGHAWVCDGYLIEKHITIHNPGDPYYEYETYTYTHYLGMNWGWYGSSNGWFISTAFSVGSYNLNYGKSMLINIHD